MTFAIIDTIGLIHHFCAFYLSELFNFPFLSFNVSFRISCFQSFYFLKISICKFDSVFYILLQPLLLKFNLNTFTILQNQHMNFRAL